ncbi:MAG: glutathione peroxidase [Rhodospirillaceae bacterium]|nr:glutathione peroxidase [Rhodospirillaceae bacterium]
MTNFLDLTAKSLRGQPVAMKEFTGKVVLVVNTASKCGLTPQYEGLEALYKKYKDQGFVILGFPCNQFGQQEPGGVSDIEQTCLINYGVSFPMFEKIDVNGAGAHPIFDLLTRALPGWFGRRVKWNFTKFLIGRDGTPLKRFAPTTQPTKLDSVVQSALGG